MVLERAQYYKQLSLVWVRKLVGAYFQIHIILKAYLFFSGENAKATRRSQNLSEFVNNDAGKAEIIIHLCNIPNENEGESAYRPDFYGNAIIFHRQIYKNGTSVYTIKGLNGERTGGKLYFTEIQEEINFILQIDFTEKMQTSKLNSQKTL